MNEKHISTHGGWNGEKFCIALRKSGRNKTRHTSDGERKEKKGRGEREKGKRERDYILRGIHEVGHQDRGGGLWSISKTFLFFVIFLW